MRPASNPPLTRGHRRWLVGLGLALVFPAPARALDPARAVTQYALDVWRTEDGLPQSSVYATVQTRDGYLWLATQEGLVRFDGVRFAVFDRGNTAALGNSFVLSLLADRAGRLWIGTGDGLVRLEGREFRGFGVAEGVPEGQVKSIFEDRAGRLWAGSLGGGLARLEGGRFVREPGLAPLATRRVQALIEDRAGAMWIGTDQGLARYLNGELTILTRHDGLTHDDINAIHEGRDGAIWIGTAGGLDRLKDGKITGFTTRQGLSNDSINAIMEDRDGNLWVGARGGVNRFRNGRFTAFTTGDGLSSEFVFSLMEDREGSLWIGTGGGGLNRLRSTRFTPLGRPEGLTNDFVRSFSEGRDGSLWIGTDGGGVNRLEDGRLTAITSKQGLPNDFVERVFEDASGVLWIGTSGGGLARLQDGRFRTFTTRDGLANDYVASIAPALDGGLWIGTRGGLSRLKDGKFTNRTTRDGLSNDIVRAVHEDRNGTVWIGTEGGGLNRLKNGKMEVLTTKDGVSSRNIVCFREDASGTLWIGTRGGGLMRYKNGRLASVGRAAGLFDDTVLTAQEDDSGRMWMTSNRGLFTAARRDLDDVLDGRRSRLESRAYGLSDGMRSAEGNGSSSSGLRARDGRLWFGTIAGAVMVDPARLSANTLAPLVHIEDVLLDGRRLDPLPAKALPPGPRAVEFHYTANSFNAPGSIAFKYRLENYDPDWVDAGSRRVAYYTGLGYGRYRFRVTAANEDGVWNDAGDALEFTVAPRVHETGPFRFAAVVLAAGLIYGTHRLRVARLRARERELVAVVEERTRNLTVEKERSEAALRDAEQSRSEAEAANRAKSAFLATMSHELRTPLNAVLGFTQLMGRQQGRDAEDREHLAIIGKSGEHLLGLINDILSLSKIEAGTVPVSPVAFEPRPMLEGLVEMLGPRARGKGLSLTLETADGFPKAVVGDEGKIRQILINLLSNALKFTAAGGVVLKAEWHEGEARLRVQDSGPGMTPAEIDGLFQPFAQTESGRLSGEGTGLGLAISRSFARLLGGDITVESAPGKGSTFEVSLPLPAADPQVAAKRRENRRRVTGLAAGQTARRVLVADDTRENRLLISRQLKSIGLEVRDASDGREAVDRWRTDAPDLILMDVRMPGMDGLEATRAIRAAEAARAAEISRVKIIALSASVLDNELDRIRAAGCDDFLPKPYREGALFEKVAQLLGLLLEFEESPSPESEDAMDDELKSALTPERVSRVSAGPRERLRLAAVVGDDQAAAAAVEEIRAEDPLLGEALARTLRKFRFDELLRLSEGADR